jgi:hypothetical protein
MLKLIILFFSLLFGLILVFCEIYNIIGKTGSGKTLLTVLLAFLFKAKEPRLKIYANFNIDIDDFTFIELGIIPFTKMKELEYVMIIFDDIKVLKNIDNFMNVIANISRKNSFDILFTSQYYTYLNKEGRQQSDYQVLPIYNKKDKILDAYFTDLDNEVFPFTFTNPNDFFDKYDTKNIIDFPDDDDIYEYVKKNTDNVKDLKTNLKSILKKTDYNKYLKKIVKEFNLEN